MKDSKVQRLLKEIVKQSNLLDLLREKPDELGEKYGLSKEELDALKSADLLINVDRAATYTTRPITITARNE
ncbi:hypothetical protein [Bacillus thuringiensis]|uniref:hypothetical protein n=1 Tax=Bacillus thuringiensis TaxID=1428 RepID=UPI00053945C9|nr:hypothetical protein [Bacillus thuringiensis]